MNEKMNATLGKRLGSSCDWSREAFTMSDSLSHAVRKVFVSLVGLAVFRT